MAFSARQAPDWTLPTLTIRTHATGTTGYEIGPAGPRGACGRAGGLRAAAAALAGPAAAALGLESLLRVVKLDLERQRTNESFSATKPTRSGPSTR